MAETLEECMARAAACREAAASEALENVRRIHLEAAASWEMLAGRTPWIDSSAEPPTYAGTVIRGVDRVLPCSGRPPFDSDGCQLAVAAVQPQLPAEFSRSATEDFLTCAMMTDLDENCAMFDDREDPRFVTELATCPAHCPDAYKLMLYTCDGHLRTLRQIEADVIRLAIELYRGRLAEVARRLGIGRSTLYRKMSELGIDIV
jgi:hypothetical protein